MTNNTSTLEAPQHAATTDEVISNGAISFGPITQSERAERISQVSAWAQSLSERPERGALTVSVEGAAAGSVGSVFHASGHRIVVDEPATLAGDGLAASPVEYVLTALLSCQVVTYRVWAANLGIVVDSIEASAEGDLDARGFLGIDDSVRPGFQGIRVSVRVSGPETEARYRELQSAVDTHCPVQDLFANQTPVTTELVVG